MPIRDQPQKARKYRGASAFCILLCAGLLVASCARFQPQPLSPAENGAQLESRSLTNESVKAVLEGNLHHEFSMWPPKEWDLEMLTLAAFCYEPELRIAQAQWGVARGAETTAAQRPNPSLNVTPGYNTTRALPSPWLPLATLDWPIETAGKRKHRQAQAAQLAEAARLHVATVAWQVRSKLHLALIDFAAATRRMELLQSQSELQDQTLRLLEQQVQAGAKAESEGYPFRIAAVKTRVDIADARRAQAESRSRIAEALGLPAGALAGIHFSDLLMVQMDASQLGTAEVRHAALTSRSDVLAALADYAASEAALQLEIARQYPDLRVVPGYQYDQGENKWSLGLTLDLPILNRNEGPIAEAKARRQEVAARFTGVQARALAEIDRATIELSSTESSVAELRMLGQQQQLKRNSISAQVQAGNLEKLELLTADLELSQTRLLQLEGEVQARKALANLEDAVQRPFEMPSVALHESSHTTF